MQANFYITVAFNGEIINYKTHSEPKVGDKFIHNGKELEVTKISQTLQFVDLLRNAMYYTCIAKEVVSHNPLVGVTQVKFITCPFGGNDAVKSLEDALNEFLWETRHTHHILDITHTNMYIVVKYRLYNDRDIDRSKVNEKQYQRNQFNQNWLTMEKQSIYLGWRYYRDINTEDLISQLVYVSSDYDTMVKTLEKEFSLSGVEFVELNENSELKSESFGYRGGLFIEEQVVNAFWNGYTPIVTYMKNI